MFESIEFTEAIEAFESIEAFRSGNAAHESIDSIAWFRDSRRCEASHSAGVTTVCCVAASKDKDSIDTNGSIASFDSMSSNISFLDIYILIFVKLKLNNETIKQLSHGII